MQTEPQVLALRKKLEQLFLAAGYRVPELEDYIEQTAQKMQALQQENQRLQRRAATHRRTSSAMHSKLSDALRE